MKTFITAVTAMMRLSLAARVTLLLYACCARAVAHECPQANAEDLTFAGQFVLAQGDHWQAKTLPKSGDVAQSLRTLEIDDAPALYFFRARGQASTPLVLMKGVRLCGAGGCPYHLFDAPTMKRVGEFFGSLKIVDEQIAGYPIIQAYASINALSGSLNTYVFDPTRHQYRLVATKELSGCALDLYSKHPAGKVK